MHSPLAGTFDVRLPHSGIGAVALPVPAEVYVQMWWRATRNPSVKGTGVSFRLGLPRAVPQMQALQACMSRQPPQYLRPKKHPQLRSLGAAARDGVLHPTKLTTSRILAPAASDCPHRGCLQVHSLLRPDVRVPTTPPVSLPPGIQSPPASDVDSSLSGFR